MRIRFAYIPVCIAVAALVLLIAGFPETGRIGLLLAVVCVPYLYGISLLVSPYPLAEDGHVSEGRLSDPYVEDSVAVQVAVRESRFIWRQLDRAERRAARLVGTVCGLSLVGLWIVADPGVVFFILLVTSFLFVLLCNSYRVEVLRGEQRTRPLTRTSLRTLRVIAFSTAILVTYLILDRVFGISRWNEEMRSFINVWFGSAWLGGAVASKPWQRGRVRSGSTG